MTFAAIQPGQLFHLPGETIIYRRPYRNEVLRDALATCYSINTDPRVPDYIEPTDPVLLIKGATSAR